MIFTMMLLYILYFIFLQFLSCKLVLYIVVFALFIVIIWWALYYCLTKSAFLRSRIVFKS